MTTLTTTDAEYLRMAIDLSRHALDDQGKTPFGAILVPGIRQSRRYGA